MALGPRFSRHGRVRFADGFEQLVVLHVAGADLEDVGVFGDELDVLGGHDLGDDGQAGLVAAAASISGLFLEALEAVGAGARLEGAAAEAGGAGLLRRRRRCEDLLFALDGAGSGDDADVAAADLQAAGA